MKEKLQAIIGKIVVAGVLMALIIYLAVYQIWRIEERRLGAGLMFLVASLCYFFYQWLKPDTDDIKDRNRQSRADL